jgi:hypothetical protein
MALSGGGRRDNNNDGGVVVVVVADVYVRGFVVWRAVEVIGILMDVQPSP